MLKYEAEIVQASDSDERHDRLEAIAEALRATHLNMCEAKIKQILFKMDTDLITTEHAEVLNHEALWKDLTADEIVRRCVAGVA